MVLRLNLNLAICAPAPAFSEFLTLSEYRLSQTAAEVNQFLKKDEFFLMFMHT